MSDDFLVERDDDITTLTVNHGDNGNRFTDEMGAEFAQLVNEASKDSRAIVFRGQGDHFCLGRAGMGSREAAAPEAYDLRNSNEVVFDAYAAFRGSKVPVIGVAQGDALGFGCALAALCDITIAADHARFQLPEMGHNIMPTMAMSALVDRVPRKAVMYITYSTKMLSAERALSFGIVSDVVSLADLESEVENLITALKKAPMPAVMAVKEYARSAITMDTPAANDFAKNLHATVNSSSKMRG